VGKLLLLVWVALTSGCFVVTRATYEGLVQPNRGQLARDVAGCTVVDHGDRVSAQVAVDLEHGPRWLYDEDGGLVIVRGHPNDVALRDRLEGGRFHSLSPGNIPCVMVANIEDVALGEVAWHFDGAGWREPQPSRITELDLRRAAFLVYHPSRDRKSSPRLSLMIPPREGRARAQLDEDECMGCNLPLAIPGWPNKAGMVGFALLLPLTAAIDLAYLWEISLICLGNQQCIDAFIKAK
jgi:hypothetical protein